MAIIMDRKEIGLELLKIRKEKGISQMKMAKDLNIARATISSIEKGNKNVGIAVFIQVVEYSGQVLTLTQRSRFPTFEELRDEREREYNSKS